MHWVQVELGRNHQEASTTLPEQRSHRPYIFKSEADSPHLEQLLGRLLHNPPTDPQNFAAQSLCTGKKIKCQRLG